MLCQTIQCKDSFASPRVPESASQLQSKSERTHPTVQRVSHLRVRARSLSDDKHTGT